MRRRRCWRVEALPGVPLSMANVLEPLKDAQKMQLTGESVVEVGSVGCGICGERVAGAEPSGEVSAKVAALKSVRYVPLRVVEDFRGCDLVGDFLLGGDVVASESSAMAIRQRSKGNRFPMSEIHGLAVHAAGAQLLPYKYDPGELEPMRSRSRFRTAACATAMFT